jgi:hypothetical protein
MISYSVSNGAGGKPPANDYTGPIMVEPSLRCLQEKITRHRSGFRFVKLSGKWVSIASALEAERETMLAEMRELAGTV